MPKRARRPNSPKVHSGSSDDIVILVMGPTGVGKSTFINEVLGQDTMTVGYDIESCTVEIATAEVDTSKLRGFPCLKDRRLLLVDTPGFDDTFKDDREILERIAKWLENSYRTHLVLGGVIYLHDISIDRFTGTARKNLTMFNRLCGDGAVDKVVLGTTKASRLPRAVAAMRLARLKEAHWNDMIGKGAQVFEFDGDHLSALRLVEAVLERFEERTVLEIQRELVDKHKIIPETEAGKELRYTLQQVLEQQKRYADLSRKAEKGDTDAEADLLEAKKQIESLSKQLQQLRVPLARRLFGFLRS